MIKINYKISKKSKDIIQKYVAGVFKDISLNFYGIKTAKVKELINVELPIIDINDNSTDFVFLLQDNTYLHLEFQTSYNKNDLIRFQTYDLRLFARDEKKIYTIVVYASNVKDTNILDIGSSIYRPQIIMLKGYDGETIYKELEKKVKNDISFNDLDIINFLFLPLMKNKKHKKTVAINTIRLAQNICDKNKRNLCIASIFAFAYKYLNEDEINSVMEVLKMTDFGSLILEQGAEKEKIKIAKKLLQKNLNIDEIIEITELDKETILKLRSKDEQ